MPSLKDIIIPLEQRIGEIESRVLRIEENLYKILKYLPVHASDDVVVSPWSGVTFSLPVRRDGTYKYQPLDKSTSEIRLIVLHSSLNEQDPINCQLLHVSVDLDPAMAPRDPPSEALKKFNTLSYTWGQLDRSSSVNLDGYRFPVTKNLEAALRRLRSLKPPKDADTPSWSFWWIDAICINQDDVLERNWQVDLMTRIYREAAGMHVWLGEAADNSDMAMEIAHQVGDTTPRGPGDRSTVSLEVYPEVSSTQREAHWKALISLFERPWWERVWVRQEVALAKEATVHCGSKACTFGALTTTLDMLLKIVEQLGFNPIPQEMSSPIGITRSSCFVRAFELANFRVAMGQRPNTAFRNLTELFPLTRTCKATDARDKVFSLLGLVDPAFWQLKADYRLSMTETFHGAAQTLISRNQSLDALSACQNPERSNGLPSWVPNLVDEWKARPFPPQLHWQEVVGDQDPDFTFENDNMVLRAQGRLIDHVGTLCQDTVSHSSTDAELDAVSAGWKEFAFTALSSPQIHVLDRSHIDRYKDDVKWCQFLSINKDRRRLLPRTAASVNTRGNYRLAKSMLLPKDEEESAVTIDGARNRIREHLRKSGIGRRLCITRLGEGKGSVALVPKDAEVDDEIWLFRGTSFPYVLRRTDEGKYVVIGETCEFALASGV
jgi:Heterokaryon incompatibility protein (HET)